MDEKLLHDDGLPAWAPYVQHACPSCRTAIALDAGCNARCPSCGFEARIERGIYSFVPRSGSANDWQETYDQLATGVLGDTAAGLLYRFPVEQRVATFRRLCGELPPGARILDVGCGNGIFWQALLDRRPAVGIDFSLEMAVQARARGMLAHQADALALPFGDAQFDLVYGAGLLEHIEDLRTLFAELGRVCRPGGRVVVGSANKASVARRVMRLIRQVKPHSLSVMRRPIVMRSVDELETAARAASLTVDCLCWTHLPFRYARYAGSAHNVFAPLASNVYTRFVKQPRE